MECVDLCQKRSSKPMCHRQVQSAAPNMGLHRIRTVVRAERIRNIKWGLSIECVFNANTKAGVATPLVNRQQIQSPPCGHTVSLEQLGLVVVHPEGLELGVDVVAGRVPDRRAPQPTGPLQRHVPK